MAKNHTIFQNLDKAFSGNWGSSSQPHINSYDMSNVDKGILYRTKSKEDYENKKLELQQSKYLKDRWVKANVDLSVSAFAGLNNVKLMYRDCDLMDGFPEISAALDIVSEESCLAGDTQIYLTHNQTITVKELYDKKYKDFFCYTIDNDSKIKVAKIEKVIYKGEQELYELTLDDDTAIKCTGNHKWMKDDYSWIETKDMNKGVYLASVLSKPHKVISVKALGIKNAVYDLFNSDVNHSFTVKCKNGMIVSHNCIPNSKGNIINVYSSSERIKSIIDDLFINRLNIQITAPMIIRAMCKYGNQFMLLDVDNKLGVKDWKQLPVFNVERIENGIVNPYSSMAANNAGDGDLSTKFVWVDENNSQVPFRNWQIAHFRLLTNSLYLPYGCLVGDTRIETEYGYKEIKDIKVGDKVWTFNVDTQKRELSTVTMWMNKGEKDTIKVFTNHNYIEGTPDHKVLVYEDKKLTYKEIKDISIGDLLVVRNGVKKAKEAIKIDKTSIKYSKKRGNNWFDDNINLFPEYMTEDLAELFGFMIGDGSITYGRIVNLAGGIQDILNDRYQSIAEKYSGYKGKRKYRKNGTLQTITFYSKFLGYMLESLGYICGFDKKRIPSWVFESPIEIKKAFIKGLINADGYIFEDKRRKNANLRFDIELENEKLIKDLKILCQSLGYKTGQIFKRKRQGHFSKTIGQYIKFNGYSFELSFYETQNTQEKCNDVEERLEDGFKLEKVKKIEASKKQTTYDITVDSKNSNFFANGIVTHNCSYLNGARRHWRILSLMEDMMLIYRLERSIERRVYKIYVGAIDDADVQAYVENIANQFKRTPIIDPMTGQLDLRKNILAVDQDLFIPTRSENAPNPVDTLPSAQNLTAIDDIKFIQNKVCTALRIPKTFLNFEETNGDGKNLALEDIRFTRTVNRIQQAFLMELTKVASIHLYLLGFTDDLTNFSITMNNPSTQAEQLEIDNLQKKISACRDAISDPGNGIPVYSQTRALKEIMKMSDKEIKDNLEEIRLEKALSAELEKTSQIIKRTGVFDIVDRMYGEPDAQYQDDAQQQGGDMGSLGAGGGMPSMGGGDFGSGLENLGAPGSDEAGDIPGAEGAEPTTDMGGGNEAEGAPTDNMPPPPSNEGVSNSKPLLTEQMKHKYRNMLKESKEKTDAIFEQYLKHLDKEHTNKRNETSVEKADVYDKSLLINEEFNKMIDGLDKKINSD
jgi:intein/homing endonuclease